MLGAIIGDIVGSRWEFSPTNDYNFELFSDKNSYTDDTICTVAVADALLHGSDDYGKFIHEWCRRYPHPMGGYGGRFAKWVWSENPQPYGSYGNGSAMRVSPIGMWFDDMNMIYPEAKKTAACTHNHPEGIKGAQAIAWAVYWAVKSFDGPMTQEKIDEEILDIVTSTLMDCDYDPQIDYEDYRNKFDETCQGTVPVALDIIFQSNSFEDAIRKAVSLGADADTLGAIVGSIAEHIWGIPNWIKEKALPYLPDEMRRVVHEFYNKCESRETYKPKRKEKEKAQKDEFKTIMRWKLGLGNLNNIMFERKSPLPDKTRKATPNDWNIQPMTADENEKSSIELNIPIQKTVMDILSLGHIPEAQEDHWFMYCDDEHIRYYRSWTGICAFEAHYHKESDDHYRIDYLTMAHSLAEFGVNGDEAGVMLFRYLITAEAEGDTEAAWNDYLKAWDKLNEKYSN